MYCDPRHLVVATDTAHGAHGCDLSLNARDSAVAAYRAFFLSRRPPAGAVVADHYVMLSCSAAAVSTVDVVKIFII